MNLIPRKYYLNDIFDSFLSVPEESNLKCDIYEKDNNYYIEMDIVGFSKDNISIECDKGYLTITAEKSIEDNDEDDNKNYIRRERSYGKYKREFYLGDINTDEINASFNDGILNIIIPKKEKISTKKQIEIK